MGLEIERKFLVHKEKWESLTKPKKIFTDRAICFLILTKLFV